MPKELYVNDLFFHNGKEFAIVITELELLKNMQAIFSLSDHEAIRLKMGSNFEYFGSYCQYFFYIRFQKNPIRMAMQIMDARMLDMKEFFEKCLGEKLSKENAEKIDFICSSINNNSSLEITNLITTASVQGEINSALN